jgi:hypothetical protein
LTRVFMRQDSTFKNSTRKQTLLVCWMKYAVH